MYKENDIVGDFVIVEIVPYSVTKSHKKAILRCSKCGRVKSVVVKDMEKGEVGIFHKSCAKGLNLKNNEKRFYTIWSNMRSRTCNPKNEMYKFYGGKGITSDPFENFIDFYDSLFSSYEEARNLYGEENITIDRINPDGNYEVSNIRWSNTKKEQARNRRNTRSIKAVSPTGEEFIVEDISIFSSENNIGYTTIMNYAYGHKKSAKGWHFEFIK